MDTFTNHFSIDLLEFSLSCLGGHFTSLKRNKPKPLVTISEPPRVLQVRVTVGVEYVVVLVVSTSKLLHVRCTWMRPVMYSIYINRRGRRKRGYGKLQLNKVRRVGLPLILP